MTLDCRGEFANFGKVAYLNTAYQGPLPLAAMRASQEALEWKTLPYRLPYSIHFDLPDRVRGKLGRIIGAEAEEIAITTGASAGLAHVAAGIDWQPGDEVLIARGEFPAHFSTWLSYQTAGKLKMNVFQPRGRFVTADDYIENIGPRTKVISASFVRFDDGARLDARRVAEACRRTGTFFVLDVSQCAGSMPLSMQELGADCAVCSGYKWLLGPYGTGFFWVKREAMEKLPIGATYFMALEGARDLHSFPIEKLRPAPGARRWDAAETASFTNLAALDASLDLLLRVGLDRVACHTSGLIRQVIEQMPKNLFALGSPKDEERRGPYVCISGRTPEETEKHFEKLRAAEVFVSFRAGALRIAPYIYNTPEDIGRLIEVLSS